MYTSLFPKRVVSGIYMLSLTVAVSILFSSCSSSRHANARFDKTVAKLEKKNRKKGRKVEIDDLYYSKKDSRREREVETTVVYEEPKETKRPEAPKKVSNNNKASAVITEAKRYMGTPHRLGGMSRSGIDCSGLMIQSFKRVNINLPRTSSEQSRIGHQVNISNLKEGDLLFFSPSASKISHVGVVSKVYSRNDIRFIHTSTSKGVREDNLFSDYWRRSFVRARRIL